MKKLLASIRRQDLEAVRGLLEAGAPVERGRWRRLWVPHEPTPLQLAVQLRAMTIARCLLDNGAAPNKGTSGLLLPLPMACYHGDLSMMELLVSRGADPNPLGFRVITPIAVAATAAHENAVRWLLSHGANPSDVFASHVSVHQISGRILALAIDAGGKAPPDIEKAVRDGKW